MVVKSSTMGFTKVTYTDIGDIIARVDHETGELELNNKIFNHLPKGFQDFVLLHEQGHLVIKSHDELQANLYAINHYLPIDVNNDEFGRRIVVMSQALTPGADRQYWDSRKNNERYSNFGIAESIAGAVGGITQVLPSLGIGSKARINETNATVNAQLALSQQNAKSNSNLILIGAGAIAVLIIIFFTVKSFK